MPKKENKVPEVDEVLKARLGREWESAKGNRSDTDWKWFIYDLFVSGNHYARYDKNTQQNLCD